ncbi:MAG: hypothetical protein AAFU81_01665 [Pseudomonadota bacterium]
MSHSKPNHYDHHTEEIQCPHCNRMIDQFDEIKVEIGVLSWNGSTMEFQTNCPHCEKLWDVTINTCIPKDDEEADLWRGSFLIRKALTKTDKKYIEARAQA